MPAFISYASGDSTVANAVDHQLDSAGVSVARDRDQMRGGGDWQQQLLPLIASCEHFVLLWSERAATSRPVQIELGRALEAGVSILVARLDEAPVPGPLQANQEFAIGAQGEYLVELVEAIAPLAHRGQGQLPGDLRAHITNLVRSVKARSAVYQVLYPDEERDTETITTLGLAEGLVDAGGATRIGSIRDLLRAREGSDRIVIVGHPGSGKSTTLRYVAHELVTQAGSQNVPILLRCSDYQPRRHATLEDFVYATIREMTSPEVERCLRDSQFARDQSISLLLDGIDELHSGSVDSFLKDLHTFLEDPNTNIQRVVVTSRFDAFRAVEEQFAGWKRLSIQPLTQDQIQDFVAGWFPNEESADKLLVLLRDRRLAELASRPFLLALMCLVYSRGGDLGPNRSELYAKGVSYLERRHADQVSEKVIETRRRVVEDLALTSLQIGSVEIDQFLASGIAAGTLESMGTAFERFEQVVAELDDASRAVGILQSALGRYSFVHRSFQEYLCSQALLRKADGEGRVLEYARVPRWEEPIRLFIGSLNTSKSQAEILRKLWPINQDLALRALTDATLVPKGFAADLLQSSDPSSRVRMLNSLRTSMADADPDTRRRLVLETVEPVLAAEADNEVVYHAIELLRWVDPDDGESLLWNYFGRHARLQREQLEADPRKFVTFADLPGGLFRMGDDAGVDDIERPAHDVWVSSFSIGRFQLTNAAYEAINGRMTGSRSSVSQEDSQPVVDLNWFDATVVAMRIGCRLPTEAEWEYAARAGGSGEWCFGDDESLLPRFANFEGSGQNGHPWAVGSGEPNAFGLHDMHGNVWEWCSDWLALYELNVGPEPRRDPQGPAIGTSRVRRGGGHSYHARGCRSAFRWGNDPSYSFKDIGARLVRDDDLIARGW